MLGTTTTRTIGFAPTEDIPASCLRPARFESPVGAFSLYEVIGHD